MVLFPRAAVAYAKIHRPAALHGLGDEREVKRHPRPFADAALSFDATAVGLYYGLGDREAKPGALLPARPGPVYAVEALEDMRQVLFGYAGTAVFDPNEQLTGLGGCKEGYLLPVRAVLGSVVHQDENSLF
jgi:hypothetical protein